jgi:hypothetical protein
MGHSIECQAKFEEGVLRNIICIHTIVSSTADG